MNNCDEDEELIQQCIEVIRSKGKARISLLQRRLRLGYTRAARIMDELEARKLVGPAQGGAVERVILFDINMTSKPAPGVYKEPSPVLLPTPDFHELLETLRAWEDKWERAEPHEKAAVRDAGREAIFKRFPQVYDNAFVKRI